MELLLYLTLSQLMKGTLHYKLYLYDLEVLAVRAQLIGYKYEEKFLELLLEYSIFVLILGYEER